MPWERLLWTLPSLHQLLQILAAAEKGKGVPWYPWEGNHPSQSQSMTTLVLQGMVSPLACVAYACGLVPASAANVLLMSRYYHRKAGQEAFLEVPTPRPAQGSCLLLAL